MRALLAVFMVLCTTLAAHSEISDNCPDIKRAPPPEPLVVGTVFSPPFVYGDPADPEGLSVSMWKLVALCLNLERGDFRYKEYSGDKDLRQDTLNGAVDVIISPFALTADDEAIFDLSFPYFTSELATLVADQTTSANFQRLIKEIYESDILKVIAGLVAFMVIVAISYWYIERRSGNDFFKGGPFAGLYRAIIWAALVVFQGRGEPFELSSRVGQLVMLFLIFFGVGIISSFTAVITSTLTLQRLEPDIVSVTDLQNKTVAVIQDEAAEQWAADNFIEVDSARSLPDAHWNLVNGSTDVVIHDKAVLQFHMARDMDGVKFSQLTLEPVSLTLAMPTGSDLRDDVNRAVLRILETDDWADAQRQYLGK